MIFILVVLAGAYVNPFADSGSDIYRRVYYISNNCKYGLLGEIDLSDLSKDLRYFLVRILNLNPLKYESIDVIPTWIFYFVFYDDGSVAFIDRSSSGCNLLLYRFDIDGRVDTLLTCNSADTANSWLCRTIKFDLDVERSLIANVDKDNYGLAIRKYNSQLNNSTLIRRIERGSFCNFSNDYEQLLIVIESNSKYPLYDNILATYDFDEDSFHILFESNVTILNPMQINKSNPVYFINSNPNIMTSDILKINDSGEIEFVATYTPPYHVNYYHLSKDSIIVYVEPNKIPDTTRPYVDVIKINEDGE